MLLIVKKWNRTEQMSEFGKFELGVAASFAGAHDDRLRELLCRSKLGHLKRNLNNDKATSYDKLESETETEKNG